MHLGDLENDLQQKLEADRKQIEALQKQELQKLQQNLAQECRSVASTIRADTEQLKQIVNRQWKWYLFLPGATLLSLLLGFSIGSWGMMRSLANQQREIQTHKQILERLQNQTQGGQLYQTDNGRFLILPPDTEVQTDWECQGKPCLKL